MHLYLLPHQNVNFIITECISLLFTALLLLELAWTQVRPGQVKHGKRQALQGAGQTLQAQNSLRRARTAFHMNRLEAWE